MRKVKDYYYKKAKKDKYPARSVYKLEEVQAKYRIIRPGDSVLDLGCHPGSWSLYASKLVGPKGLVVGADLQQTEQAVRPGGAAIHWLCHDITDKDFIHLVRKIRSGFKVIISDMAPKTTGNKWADAQQSINLVYISLELADALLLNRGNYICKVFQGGDFPVFVEDVKKRFSKVKIIKPKSSRTESREVFVLGMDFRKHPAAENKA